MRKKKRVFRLILAGSFILLFFSCTGKKEADAPQKEVKKSESSAIGTKAQIADKRAVDSEKAGKIEALIITLEGSDEREAYDAALKLSLMGDETAVEPLITVYERSEGMMRAATLKALGSIGDKASIDILLDALNDDETDIRRIAAAGLGNFNDESAVEPLIEILNDDDDWVRWNAGSSLNKITKKEFPDYDSWSEWYEAKE
ncbi:MAG: HEAT repeat domain-containing protein [Deltaproteobacteria bacterium]|nr:HEAT repeat domain-containing protein [Deltaproteobacteria bacterium]